LALHAGNPAADWVSIVNTSLFGLLFGFAVVRYRSLWPSVGMHLGWNLSLAILGANISGLRMGLTALRATPAGPVLWTGGDYGPEASLVATIAVLVAAVVVWKAPVPADDSPLIWDDIRSSKGVYGRLMRWICDVGGIAVLRRGVCGDSKLAGTQD
jgi:hypothetical protein